MNPVIAFHQYRHTFPLQNPMIAVYASRVRSGIGRSDQHRRFHMRTSVFGLACALLAAGAARAEVTSGNPVGKKIGGAFNIKCVSGPAKGQTYCQV